MTASAQLVPYNDACRAIAVAKDVVEAKKWRDKGEAMRLLARVAKNRDLEIDAIEIRLRAERRVGELIIAQKDTIGLHKGGRPAKGKTRSATEQVLITLEQAGIDRKLSMRAQQAARVPVRQYDARLKDWRERAKAGFERLSVDVMKSADQKEVRAKRERVMGGLQLADPQGRHGVIYVDVPRKFNVRSAETGMGRSPDNHYRTMTFEQLLDFGDVVNKIAADDCVLYFWSTAASLLDDLEIIADWGFAAMRPRDVNGKILRNADAKRTAHAPPNIKAQPRKYASHIVWDKVNIGNGYWVRDRHEVLIIAYKGNPPPPAMGTQNDSIITAKKSRKHSEKPLGVQEMIERHYPTMPKIELFGRRARKGWRVWGDQAPGAKFKTKRKRRV